MKKSELSKIIRSVIREELSKRKIGKIKEGYNDQEDEAGTDALIDAIAAFKKKNGRSPSTLEKADLKHNLWADHDDMDESNLKEEIDPFYKELCDIIIKKHGSNAYNTVDNEDDVIHMILEALKEYYLRQGFPPDVVRNKVKLSARDKDFLGEMIDALKKSSKYDDADNHHYTGMSYPGMGK